MSHISFVQGTVVPASWLNDVDTVIYTYFGNGTSLNAPTKLQVTQGVFSTSVVTPLLNSGTDVRLLAQINGTNKWLFGNSGDGFNFSPSNDNAQDIGFAPVVVRTIFARSMDSGTAASLLFKTNSGTTQAEVQHKTGTIVNWIGLGGNTTGADAVVSALGETNASLGLGTKGTGSINFYSSSLSNLNFEVLGNVASVTRHITIAASNGGNPIVGTTGGGVAIVGTPTNDNASAGQYGEYISSSVAGGSAIALTTNTPANITSITLTAGDWDVTGCVVFNFGVTTSYTNLIGECSQTSATLVSNERRFDFETPAVVPTAGADMSWTVPTQRILTSSTTTVFLVTQATFTVSTLKAYGIIRARRMR